LKSAKHTRRRASETGSALVYILIAIALLAALTITFMEPSSQQTSSQNTFKTVTEVQSQESMIRSAIQQCVLSYPKGDPTISNSGGSPTDEGARKTFPIKPNSTHFTGAVIGPTAGRLVKDIRCPGNNPGAPDQKEHALIFSGADGKLLPPPPALFGDWQYYNGNDGVFFWIATDKTDAFIESALAKLDEQYAECETDIVDARSGAQDLDDDNIVECPAGSVCFRTWLLKTASAVFNGDTDGDEAAANCDIP
jgi:hypothetical protein